MVVGALELTGASRLVAAAATRIGAGLVTLVAESRADVYRTSLPADIMVSEDMAGSRRSVTALVLGSGGLPDGVLDVLKATDPSATAILDAAAIASHEQLGARFVGSVLTPHDGEFAAAFPDLVGSRNERAARAAERSRAVVVLKGPETVIARPDGSIIVNRHASPYLAKAGSGDVLAGMIAGLAAQGMSPFDASCAGVWMHGESARRFGPGLVPDDLIDGIPSVLASLLEN